ncbi:MAG: ribosome maturation factor RimP [Deltaproteobacteria bacterium]|nr:ribosome maturation factor RimP [Deltaproteobacteria bacterium]
MITPVLDELGLELVDLQFGNEQDGLVLRVTMYKDTGVSIDDCSLVSRQIGHLLEIEEPIKKAFRLEVSSPGLTRPLVTERDFSRNCGKKVKIKFASDDGAQKVVGIIGRVEADRVEIITEGHNYEILLTKIHKAKLAIEF